MKLIFLFFITFSMNSFAEDGKVTRRLSEELVQTMWLNEVDFLRTADIFFRDNIYDSNSVFLKELKRVYEEKTLFYAQPRFPQDFINFSLQSKAILVSEGSSTLGFEHRYIVPLHGLTDTKEESLIAWISIDVYGQFGSSTTVSLKIVENNLVF